MDDAYLIFSKVIESSLPVPFSLKIIDFTVNETTLKRTCSIPGKDITRMAIATAVVASSGDYYGFALPESINIGI